MNAFRMMSVALVLALPLNMATLAKAQTAEAGFTTGKITVSGEGRVDLAPDMATITLGVTTQSPTAGVALSDNSARVAEVLAQLTAAGIEARDIQTSGLSLNPQFNYDTTNGNQTPEIVGYIAMNNVTVRVRALDSLGGVMDAAVKNGANQFNGLVFGLIEPEPSMDEARKRAVADAKRKAALYAEAAGVTLGPILSITESAGYSAPSPMMFKDARASAEAVPVAGGEVGMTAMVTIEYALAQ